MQCVRQRRSRQFRGPSVTTAFLLSPFPLPTEFLAGTPEDSTTSFTVITPISITYYSIDLSYVIRANFISTTVIFLTSGFFLKPVILIDLYKPDNRIAD